MTVHVPHQGGIRICQNQGTVQGEVLAILLASSGVLTTFFLPFPTATQAVGYNYYPCSWKSTYSEVMCDCNAGTLLAAEYIIKATRLSLASCSVRIVYYVGVVKLPFEPFSAIPTAAVTVPTAHPFACSRQCACILTVCLSPIWEASFSFPTKTNPFTRL